MHSVRDQLVEVACRKDTVAHCGLNGQRLEDGTAMHSDEDLQAIDEDAARFRQQQIDYERHGGEDDMWVRGLEHEPETVSRLPWIVGAIFVVLCVLFVIFALSRKAHAQTTAPLLVRTCPTQPTATGFSACTTSIWSAPAPSLILDVLRSGPDMWITPSQLAAGDRVFACQDPTVTAGQAFGSGCPSVLPGQTNNYLAASSISFAPLPSKGTLSLTWNAVTTDDEIPPVSLTAAQIVGYSLFLRLNDGTQPLYASAPTLQTPSTAAIVPLTAGPWCAEVQAYFVGPPVITGPLSDETCVNVTAQVITPAKVTGLQQAAAP